MFGKSLIALFNNKSFIYYTIYEGNKIKKITQTMCTQETLKRSNMNNLSLEIFFIKTPKTNKLFELFSIGTLRKHQYNSLRKDFLELLSNKINVKYYEKENCS